MSDRSCKVRGYSHVPSRTISHTWSGVVRSLALRSGFSLVGGFRSLSHSLPVGFDLTLGRDRFQCSTLLLETGCITSRAPMIEARSRVWFMFLVLWSCTLLSSLSGPTESGPLHSWRTLLGPSYGVGPGTQPLISCSTGRSFEHGPARTHQWYIRAREGRGTRPRHCALRALWQRQTKSFKKTSSLKCRDPRESRWKLWCSRAEQRNQRNQRHRPGARAHQASQLQWGDPDGHSQRGGTEPRRKEKLKLRDPTRHLGPE